MPSVSISRQQILSLHLSAQIESGQISASICMHRPRLIKGFLLLLFFIVYEASVCVCASCRAHWLMSLFNLLSKHEMHCAALDAETFGSDCAAVCEIIASLICFRPALLLLIHFNLTFEDTACVDCFCGCTQQFLMEIPLIKVEPPSIQGVASSLIKYGDAALPSWTFQSGKRKALTHISRRNLISRWSCWT